MSRLEEIKEEIAKSNKYDSWDEYWAVLSMTNNATKMESLLNEISKLYAKEVAQASLEKASENIHLKDISIVVNNSIDGREYKDVKYIINNHENIVIL